jgi:hypothetical protein
MEAVSKGWPRCVENRAYYPPALLSAFLAGLVAGATDIPIWLTGLIAFTVSGS